MSKKNPWMLPAFAGVLALNLAFAEEAQDMTMKRTIQHLEEELQLLEKQPEIHKTEGKMESDLRIVTERMFGEEMLIDVHIQSPTAGDYEVSIGVATDLERQFYPELRNLITSVISVDEVNVHIFRKLEKE